MKKLFTCALALAALLPAWASPLPHADALMQRRHESTRPTISTLKVDPAAKPALPRVARTKAEAMAQNPTRLYMARSARKLASREVAPMAAPSTGTVLNGIVTYSSRWSSWAEPGVYALDTQSASAFTELWKPDQLSGASTGFYTGGQYYVTMFEDWGFMQISCFSRLNLKTRESAIITSTFTTDYRIYTATYLPERGTGLAYAVRQSDQADVLVSLSMNGDVVKLADLPAGVEFWGGLTVDKQGKVYGMSKTGDLYTINTSTYACTKIGSTGAPTDYATALCYDEKADLIYYTTCPEEGKAGFYSVNPATAAATLLYNFADNEEIRVLNVPAPDAADDAPAAPTELQANFPSGSLSGTVSFLPPATTYGGNPGSGRISYVVEVDGVEAATGRCSYGGERVEAPVTVSKAGVHLFRVYCETAAGVGADASLSTYIGLDVPLPVESVTLTYADGKMQLTWPEVKGESGGYVDPARLNYVITRYVNGTASEPMSVRTTSYSEDFAEPASGLEMVYYTVNANYGGINTGATASNKVMLGYLNPPYADFFDSAASMDDYIVLDNNRDGRSWLYDDKMQAAYCRDAMDSIDDYLVWPAMRLEKGKIYFISFVAGTVYEDYTESMALYVGRKPEVEYLTRELIAPTTYNTPMKLLPDGTHEGTPFSCSFIPEETGVYYFATKSCSPLDQYRNFLSDIQISAPSATAAPASVTELTLTPDPDGEPVVTITFKAPTHNLDGAPLKSLNKIDVYRGDILVKSVKPAPGEKVTVVDNSAGTGDVTYSIIASNEAGEGVAATATVFVGFNRAEAPSFIKVRPGADYGQVVIDWGAVSTDINGVTLPDVTYSLGHYNDEGVLQVIAEDLTETTFTYRVCNPDDEQKFALFAIVAVGEGGESDILRSEAVCVGAPYTMPWKESFGYGDNNQLNSILGIQTITGQGGWASCSDDTFGDLASQDGDDAFVVFMGREGGDSSRLFTGRISIPANAASPEFSFWYFCVAPDDENLIEVLVNTGEGFVPLYSRKAGVGVAGSWNRTAIDLSAYKGRDIQIALQGTLVSYMSTAFDNMRVADVPRHDLSASMRVPADVMVGYDLPVNAIVSNFGSEPAQGYSVELIVNHEVVETITGQALPSMAYQSFNFNYNVPRSAPETLSVRVRVVYEGDADPGNNDSETALVTVLSPDYPAVDDLEGTATASGGAELTWSAPEYAAYQRTVVDDFEQCESFATMGIGNAAGWTFADLDELGVGGIQNLNIPNLTVGQKASFFVLDSSAEGFNLSFGAHSGNKCLAAMFNERGGQNDDWAISPRLSGAAQKISFYARAYDAGYPESIQMLYSKTDTNPFNFTPVEFIDNVTTNDNRDWTLYEFEVPEGAQYFAIRYSSTDSFMVMIDDVTYAPAGLEPMELLGYNVYRDGVQLNDELLTTTSFTDADHVAGARYVVTAVYNAGESKASNAVYPHGNAVDTPADATIVAGLQGAILVEGTTDTVSITDMQGRVIYRGAQGRIPAPAGAYVVCIGRRSYKVLVK